MGDGDAGLFAAEVVEELSKVSGKLCEKMEGRTFDRL